MKRILSAVKFDMKFQFRHGFYYVYLLFTVLYIIVLRLVPEGIRLPVASIIILSDPGILGFFMIGAIVMLERGQNLYSGLFSTPLRTSEYLAAKTISLGIISLASSLVIALVGLGQYLNLLLIVPGIFLTAMFFTLVGFAPALRFKSLPVFLLLSPAYIIIFYAPILLYFGIVDSVLFYLLPTTGALMLIDGSLTGLSTGLVFYSIGIIIVWLLGAWQLAERVLYRHIIQGGRAEE